MMSSAVLENAPHTTVGMGQIVVARDAASLSAVLGSCIGVALYHAGMKLGVLGHVVLPDSHGRKNNPGKFADSAIPAMLQAMHGAGASRGGVIAKIVGGASMFGAGGPLQIGEANARAVVAALDAAGIPIVARDIGGVNGRRVVLTCSNGKITITIVGGPAKVI